MRFFREKTYVVAEMACAHEGDPERARAIIAAAANGKADAIQFQLFTVKRLISPLVSHYELAKKLELPGDVWPELFGYARSLGLEVWATVFDEEAMAFACREGADVIKIHSSDLANPELLELAARSGRPLALAVGGSLPEEIERSVHFLRELGAGELLLMHGFQAYPTRPYDSHLRFIETLRTTYGCPVGYQDHTDGASPLAVGLPLAAIGFGAVVLEKHLTDDRDRHGIDYESSLGPVEFAAFVKMVREIDEAAGNGLPRPLSEAEVGYRTRMKKSAVLLRSVRQGEEITAEKIDYLRSGTGMSPWEMRPLLGRCAARDLDAYTPLTSDDLLPSSMKRRPGCR